MITKFNLSQTRTMAFFQAMSDVKNFLEKENLETLKLNTVAEYFFQAFDAYDEAMKPARKSEYTAQIQELDLQRDTMLTGLGAHLRAFAYFPIEEQKQAAKRIQDLIEKYGKDIQSKPLQEETAIITNLLQDLATDAAIADLNSIGAKPWVDALKTSNTQLENLHHSRTEEQSTIEVGRTKATRAALADAFKTLVQTINAFALAFGKEPYANLANAINQVVRNAK